MNTKEHSGNCPDISENEMMCKMLRLHLPHIYDNIYIPYTLFRDAHWDIPSIINDNKDALFYNKKYSSANNTKKFNLLFEKYSEMLLEIFSSTNKLYHFLKKWTAINGRRLLSDGTNSYLRRILRGKYQEISPYYVIRNYSEILKEPEQNRFRAVTIFEKYLDEIIDNYKKANLMFSRKYNTIISNYVYGNIQNPEEMMNDVMSLIISHIERMLELNIYSIHASICDVINYYIPLDEINQYDPKKNENREILII